MFTRFNCPHCMVGLKAKAELAGCSSDCPQCEGEVIVPTQAALVPAALPDLLSEIIAQERRKMAQRRNRCDKDTAPMELTLPNGRGSTNADVSQETANAMSTTFFGGLLVGMGVVLMAMFGVKSRSA